MAKFSLFGGDDDAEEEEQRDRDIGGSSRRIRKKPRLNTAHGGSTSGEQEEEEEDRIPEIDPLRRVEGFGTEAGLRSPIETDDESPATGDKPLPVWLTEPDVLDCCICFEPLTIPVFQCENGHIACSSCCTKIRHKCPSCSWPIGYNRCRAIEKVLESLTTACRNQPHGCKETVSYSQKTEHEKACIYAPCECPLTTCTFVSSSEQLRLHFATCHPDSARRFRFTDPVKVELKPGKRFLFFQEERGNDLFVLHRSEERLGSVMWVSCVSAGLLEGSFGYTVVVGGVHVNIALKSVAASAQGRVDQSLPSGEFLVVPSGFLGTGGEIALELIIVRI